MDYAIRFTEQLREHIRALRKRRGLTQAQLGERLGVGQARVAEIEANPGLVNVDQMVKLMSALGAAFVLREGDDVVQVKAIVKTVAVKKVPTNSAPKPRSTKTPKSFSTKTVNTARKTYAISSKKGSW
jgi:HTH-type transcriptional regulator / antitoxin HipB